MPKRACHLSRAHWGMAVAGIHGQLSEAGIIFSGEKVCFQNPVKPLNLETDIIQTENRIHIIRGGKARGQLFGGNLALLTAMLGSQYLPSLKGAILFVEDVDEQYY